MQEHFPGEKNYYPSSQIEPVDDRPQDAFPVQVFDLAGNVAQHIRLEDTGPPDQSIIRRRSCLGSNHHTLVDMGLRLVRRGTAFRSCRIPVLGPLIGELRDRSET